MADEKKYLYAFRRNLISTKCQLDKCLFDTNNLLTKVVPDYDSGSQALVPGCIPSPVSQISTLKDLKINDKL